MEKQYQEATLETVEELKARGFVSVQFILQDNRNQYQALVKVVPGMNRNFQLDSIPLDSREILDYLGERSDLAKYVIDREHLGR